MNEPIELTKVKVIQVNTPDKIRHAYIEGFEEPVIYGVHGGVQEFYGATPDEEYPSTLDQIVAAAGG